MSGEINSNHYLLVSLQSNLVNIIFHLYILDQHICQRHLQSIQDAKQNIIQLFHLFRLAWHQPTNLNGFPFPSQPSVAKCTRHIACAPSKIKSKNALECFLLPFKFNFFMVAHLFVCFLGFFWFFIVERGALCHFD